MTGRTTVFADDAYVASRGSAAFDVHPDGERFAMIRRGPPRGDVIVVLDWAVAVARGSGAG